MSRNNDELNAKIKQEFQSIFRQNGLRMSEQRDAVLDVFFSTERHLSVEDILKETKRKGVEVSETTVNRLMELLCEYGIAQERSFKGDVVRYEHNHIGEHHDHMICLRCRKIMEFKDHHLEQIQNTIARSQGFHLIQHKMEMYGICRECFGAEEDVISLHRVPEGDKFSVVEVMGGKHMIKHLESLGLYPGSAGEVIRNRGMGQVVLAIKGSRVALGHRMAHKIMVAISSS
jgi:Fur family ferric uptake transcriptional regulator